MKVLMAINIITKNEILIKTFEGYDDVTISLDDEHIAYIKEEFHDDPYEVFIEEL